MCADPHCHLLARETELHHRTTVISANRGSANGREDQETTTGGDCETSQKVAEHTHTHKKSRWTLREFTEKEPQ